MSELAPSTDHLSGSVDLTARKIEILRRLSGGRIYKDVAPELFISVGTLKNHVHRILTKTGTRKLLQLHGERAASLGQCPSPDASSMNGTCKACGG